MRPAGSPVASTPGAIGYVLRIGLAAGPAPSGLRVIPVPIDTE
jgi:hypothetical protein